MSMPPAEDRVLVPGLDLGIAVPRRDLPYGRLARVRVHAGLERDRDQTVRVLRAVRGPGGPGDDVVAGEFGTAVDRADGEGLTPAVGEGEPGGVTGAQVLPGGLRPGQREPVTAEVAQ